jgi:hypothetical protein
MRAKFGPFCGGVEKLGGVWFGLMFDGCLEGFVNFVQNLIRLRASLLGLLCFDKVLGCTL